MRETRGRGREGEGGRGREGGKGGGAVIENSVVHLEPCLPAKLLLVLES